MEHVRWGHAAVGAVLATLGIRIAQAVTGLAAEAGALETAYGDLASVALLASWALVVGAIVLVGAAVVAVLEGQDRTGDDSEERFHPR